MGGYINVGYRSRNGDVHNALAYTSDLNVFPRCSRFLEGDETRVAELVARQANARDFGPYVSAPYSYGYRFADFQTRTLFDMQHKEHILGIPWNDMALSISRNDGNFTALIPAVRSVTKSIYVGDRGSFNLNDFERHQIELPHCKTIEELFDACGFDDFPELVDFETLNIDPGNWNIRSFPTTLKGAEEFRTAFSLLIELNQADNEAWDEYIRDWTTRSEN